MNMIFELKNITFFIILITLVYLPFKGRTFVGISWMRALVQSVLFIIGSGLFISSLPTSISFILNSATISIFIFVTLFWFLAPWYVRKFGKEPTAYIRDNPVRYVVRFESKVMTMKYFEILFQQASLMFVFFVLLGKISTGAQLFWFFIYVVVSHTINIYLIPDIKAALFWLKASIPMGILFGPLLLSGHVLTTLSIHITAYMFFVSYWFPNAKKWRLL